MEVEVGGRRAWVVSKTLDEGVNCTFCCEG